MGTSTCQRSPGTAEWERVRDLYREGVRDPAEIARRITQALSPATRAEMAGPGVVACLDVLLCGADEAARVAREDPAACAASVLSVAAGLRRQAERRLASERLGSRFADLALDALGAAALDTLSPRAAPGSAVVPSSTDAALTLAAYALHGRLHELARQFFTHDMDRCFRYFVARDISEFVGTAALPTVTQARAVADNVASHCSHLAAEVPFAAYEDEFLGGALSGAAGRATDLQDPFRHLLDAGLSSILGG